MTPGQGEQPEIRVMVVDDHDVVRTGLRALITDEPGLAVVAEAANAADAVARSLAVQPDVVVLDVRLGPGEAEEGITACREIRSELPDTRVLMFSSFGTREAVTAALLAGATGFLTKNVSHRRLVEGIRAAAAGESMLDSAVTGEVLGSLRALAQGGGEAGPKLSPREREVLQLMAHGLTNKEIARALDPPVSPITARNHVSRVLHALDVSNRTEAVVVGTRAGLIDDTDDEDEASNSQQ
jgi:two-component system response regulator DevR